MNSGGLSDPVFFSWNTPGTKTVTVQATNVAGSANDTHVVTILDLSTFQYQLYLPMATLPVSSIVNIP